MKKNILFNFATFACLLLTSSVIPLKYFYLFFVFLAAALMFYKINPFKFAAGQKIILFIIIFYLPFFLYFYFDKIIFKTGVDFLMQINIVSNVVLKTSAAILTINFYKKINTFGETLDILIKFRIPVRILLIVVISVRLISLFVTELNNFLRNFKMRVFDADFKTFF
ncbi:MAG TPA: hypothetical protein PLQ81_01285 [bacterium]|nr:hypothetical protein [bacterium]